jgi:hypothetical protein
LNAKSHKIFKISENEDRSLFNENDKTDESTSTSTLELIPIESSIKSQRIDKRTIPIENAKNIRLSRASIVPAHNIENLSYSIRERPSDMLGIDSKRFINELVNFNPSYYRIYSKSLGDVSKYEYNDPYCYILPIENDYYYNNYVERFQQNFIESIHEPRNLTEYSNEPYRINQRSKQQKYNYYQTNPSTFQNLVFNQQLTSLPINNLTILRNAPNSRLINSHDYINSFNKKRLELETQL